MLINADNTIRALVHAQDLPWVASPQAGVERRMLARIGDEVAQATTIVRYAKGSAFPAHTHDMGEEYLVLDGVFQDEMGDHPAGRYVRNPPGSRHTPGSQPGTVIFVKLRQFDAHDRKFVEVDLGSAPQRRDAHRPGVRVQDLHRDARETVSAEYWQRDQIWQETFPHGAELLVLQGQMQEGQDTLRAWSWLRLPAGARLDGRVLSDTAKIWVKRHLART
jgi:quercetin dioxygenase-like cupin family protein